MKLCNLLSTSLLLSAAQASRFVMYWDEWHKTAPTKTVNTDEISHVVLAFASSTGFTTEYGGFDQPFMTVDAVKSMFGSDTKVMIAIGGWGDNAGFSTAAKTQASRQLFAHQVATFVNQTGADGIDIDWEYPGGNGADYRQVPNSERTSELETFPQLLQEVRDQLDSCGPDKLLSIAVPGLQRDMIAFTKETGPKIWPHVDMVNVMSYDLLNRRDNQTRHHTGIAGSSHTIQNYLAIGCPPEKMNLGFAFYAKYFKTKGSCGDSLPFGCALDELELADGSDAGKSGALTFEKANGDTYIQADVQASWEKAQANAKKDSEHGGMWYFDSEAQYFWTWDSPDIMKEKFDKIVKPNKLGGVMAWSLGEDSLNYGHLDAISQGLQAMSG